MTLADNTAEDARDDREYSVPDFPHPVSDHEVAAQLAAPYPLTGEMIDFFRTAGYVRLPGMIPAPALATLAARAGALLRASNGTDNPGRFLALEQVWLRDSLLCAVALSRRIGDVAARLMGVATVRLYHDNILSKEPGCGRTPWHRDRDHYPLDSAAVCTSWLPLHELPAAMGTLICLPRSAAAKLPRIPHSPTDKSYDERVTAEIRAAGAVPDASPFGAGEASFHAADCFHSAGPNLTAIPRRVLSSTYYADGTRVVGNPGKLSGNWQEFLPGVEPGEPAVSPLNPVVGSALAATPTRA